MEKGMRNKKNNFEFNMNVIYRVGEDTLKIRESIKGL